MRLAKLDENILNKKLALTIKSSTGRKLIQNNVVLSERVIKRLKSNGLNAIYIEDENVDVELRESITEDKRIQIIQKLNEIYSDIQRGQYNDIEFGRFIRNEILPSIVNEPVSLPIGQVMKEEDISQHSLNVCLLVVRTGIAIGLNQEKIEQLAKAALLHEVGKLIQKSDKRLEEIPYEELGYRYLKQKHSSVLVYTTVRFQNETIDGKGTLKIPESNQNELVKILSICNYYESLLRTTHLLPHQCFEKVQALVNTKFDTKVFEAFRKSIYIYPIGLPVKLNNGEEGIVFKQNELYPLRPIVKANGQEYNLLENLSLFIEEVLM
ncbi:HD-GYP domain-containing protein [Caldisalinibacter kiritimatiensis]|uniref:HD-GYP domain protein n=1 Tax=Caldisalinibacter kiritimatiensis TaxID=1304284 RepID=R1AUE7_9FIRM|nr:HD domain-containing protein [Caldisalinibacter kiritimatiensis]EOD00788.1 HD-GYP domain protein [Caldisalinibacter kiritimatiensis]